MAKNLYVDTDNNRLIAGPLTTQLAARQVFYGGNTETVTVDLIQRDALGNLLNLAQASGTTVALLLGTPSTVISVPSLGVSSQAGITATATCSLFSTATATATANLYTGVTATATASLFGNITALATASVTRGTACTLSLTVASVRTPAIQVGTVTVADLFTATTPASTVACQGSALNYFKISNALGTAFLEILDPGQNLLGSPQVYYAYDDDRASPAATATISNITSNFTFQNGRLISADPSFLLAGEAVNMNGPSGHDAARIWIVPDPDFLASAESVTVASGGTGFPDGVNIPFSIPSDETGDGRPCTGFVRAVNGSVVSVVSISSRGSRFTSSTTTGKNHGLLPHYKISSLSVTCAGAGYWASAPAVTIDNLYYDATAPAATPAVATAVTLAGGGITLRLDNAGYGYTTAPAIRVAAPRISDGVRLVTLTNTPSGYGAGTYACTVSGPASGVTASVNLVVTAGGSAFVVAESGSGYTSAPGVVAPAPNLTGSVASVSVTCQGFGYTSAPTVSFTGSGTGAAGTAVLSGGRVISVTVTTWGSGYSGPVTVSFSPPANQGRVERVTILTAGTNYLTAPTVTFSGGGGSGAAASTQILFGSVTSVILSDGGSGYATPPAVILAASPARTVYSGVLTVTTAFVNSLLPATAVTLQVNAVSTVGTSTLLQTPAAIAASL